VASSDRPITRDTNPGFRWNAYGTLDQRSVGPSSIEMTGIRASPPIQPTAKANRHVYATCGPTIGSAKPPPKLPVSPLKLGQAGVKPRDGTIWARWRDSDRETASNGFVSKPVLIKKMDKETRGTSSHDRL